MFNLQAIFSSLADNLNFDFAFNALKIKNFFVLYDVIISDVITLLPTQVDTQNFFIQTCKKVLFEGALSSLRLLPKSEIF